MQIEIGQIVTLKAKVVGFANKGIMVRPLISGEASPVRVWVHPQDVSLEKANSTDRPDTPALDADQERHQRRQGVLSQ